ncbi:MAG TPA: ADP-forming succinate--CoA ligase subunit beta [Kiritimatiellia bacterium]|nr:ADP-forming succinate--CoA ligase subunit beta [Kiritimatiellia bacterium]HMP33483.1 ADP-forming succinate--CoA ligase subunit beta [Kiritimatiellia bacterium]
MKIHEYQAKQLFQQAGIPVPTGVLATTPDEAAAAAAKHGGIVAIKAQVHAGGRGKAGGIKVVKTPDDARAAAAKILGMDIKGSTVRKVWVEAGSSIAREAYLSVMLDRSTRSILFIASAAGGIDIEEVAEKTPEKILKFSTTSLTFPEAEARAAAGQLFEDAAYTESVLDIMRKLFAVFVEKDCSLVEINPLVLTHDKKVIALDGKVNFDDNALFRHPDIEELRDMGEEDPNEILAKSKGLSYVQLDGDIGCMVNGAGLAMATMDMVKLFGGQPANFLDVGGSSNPEKVIHAFKIILSKGNIKAVLINIFGGITRCDDIARGILESFKQITIDVPVVVRLTGTNAEQGLALLEGSKLIPAATFADAVRKVIVASGGTVVEEHNQ